MSVFVADMLCHFIHCCLCVGVCVRGRWTAFVTLKTSRSGSVRAREITVVYVRRLRSAPGVLSEQCLHMSVLSLQNNSSLTNTWNLKTVNKSFRVTFSSPATGDGIIVSCDLRSSALERHYLTIYLVLDTSLSLFLSSLSLQNITPSCHVISRELYVLCLLQLVSTGHVSNEQASWWQTIIIGRDYNHNYNYTATIPHSTMIEKQGNSITHQSQHIHHVPCNGLTAVDVYCTRVLSEIDTCTHRE